MNNPYENLANAIILKSAQDYREALGILRFSPKDKDASITKNEIERFFRSGWFGLLTNIDPEMLISKLRKEVV
ncbi:hypothetical protein [Acetanaerobacterium elongatum]|uniref:EF-hand domain-containing protein n=1 Tax=Acetanaerobacterium elongatum TaxID=258515 RepID=A0A1G9Y946_9FIRM|nr:hypothetical protein [Acetanaerobacterium elongatum]SDN04953.1 hypothetical protein SAMN05192585_11037 [Acetanaerobacterium elongatum]